MRGAALSDSLAIIPQRRVPSSHTGPRWVTQLPYGAALPAVLPAELLLPWEKKRLGAKRGFKPLYEGIKGLCPGFRSCFLFLFLLLSIFVFCFFSSAFRSVPCFPLSTPGPKLPQQLMALVLSPGQFVLPAHARILLLLLPPSSQIDISYLQSALGFFYFLLYFLLLESYLSASFE